MDHCGCEDLFAARSSLSTFWSSIHDTDHSVSSKSSTGANWAFVKYKEQCQIVRFTQILFKRISTSGLLFDTKGSFQFICFSRGPSLGGLSTKSGPCRAAAAVRGSVGRRWCGSAMSRPLSAAATDSMDSRCLNASPCHQMLQEAGRWSSQWGSGWSTWVFLSMKASCCLMDLMTCDIWWASIFQTLSHFFLDFKWIVVATLFK